MTVDVSYIVPVYNALPELRQTVDSLVGQAYDSAAYEVIFVDDGSNDGSGPFLDEVALAHCNVRVIHEEPSGGPSTPRNVGLAQAQGDYVFFCDADDWMEPDATARMMTHAGQWNPDVMLVKPKGERGRHIAAGAFDQTLADADVYASDIGQALGPCKLFKRIFLEENDLAFTFDLPVWEDQPFVLKAYLLADRVSVAADGVYCHWLGGGEDNSSSARERIAFEDACAYLTTMFQLIAEHGSIEQAKYLIIPRILREGLFYAARALARDDAIGQRQAKFDALYELVKPYFTDGVYRICNVQRSLMYRAFWQHDMASWLDICHRDVDDEAFATDSFRFDDSAHAVSVVWEAASGAIGIDGRGRMPLEFAPDYLAWDGDDLILSGTMDFRSLFGVASAKLRLVKRNAGEWVDVPADISFGGDAPRLTAFVPAEMFVNAGRVTYWDSQVVVFFENKRVKKQRVFCTDEFESIAFGCAHSCVGVQTDNLVILPYKTASGKLAFIDCLCAATVTVEKRLLGGSVELKGVPKRVFQIAGSIDVLYVYGKKNRIARFDANGRIDV